MQSYTATRYQYKQLCCGEVIIDQEPLVIVAVGPSKVMSNGSIQSQIICQGLHEGDQLLELETAISRPIRYPKASYKNLEIGTFSKIGGTDGKYARIIGINSMSWSFTDLEVTFQYNLIAVMKLRE